TYDNIIAAQKHVSSRIESIEKETKIWVDVIQDLRIMALTDEKILLSEKIFDDAKNNMSRTWSFSVEWRMKVLEEASTDLQNIIQKGEYLKSKIFLISKLFVINFQDNSSQQNLTDKIKEHFTKLIKEDLYKTENLNKDKMEELSKLNNVIVEASKGLAQYGGTSSEMENSLGSWMTNPANTIVPKESEISVAVTKFRMH
ncbi:hypothetical protein KI387_040409, partial [Taxus chinensis]